MPWIKLNSAVEMWETPALGKENPDDGNRFMALCIDPSSKNPYRGITRHVFNRQGDENVPGYVDFSKLVLVESYDLFSWKVLEDLEIKGLKESIKKLPFSEGFMGTQDPDILIGDKKDKHVYFTIPLKYPHKNDQDVYLGHATGKTLDDLTFEGCVLGTIGTEINGFKELSPSPIAKNGQGIHLTEIQIRDNPDISAIAAVKSKDFGGNWEYLHLAHDPRKSKYLWCRGFSSPCRILPKSFVDPGKDLYVLIMNGRVPIIKKEGKNVYGDFLPGLALYNPETGEMPWVAPKPLFKDPVAKTITFTHEFIISNGQGILFAHPNDSFIRAYRLNPAELKKLLPKN